MSNNQDFEEELASIHQLMQRSAKFISLSGMSGILAGLYALAGATFAYFRFQYPESILEYRLYPVYDINSLKEVMLIALVVLMASLSTGLWLTMGKAKRHGITIWNETSRRLILNLSIPLVTGGIFIIICAWQGQVEIVAAACLIFYGLALVNASPNLYDEIRYLGYSEIALGILAQALPGYSLLFWSLGFGVLHIIYGAAMFRKYDR
ncbi:MAG: hypothetical protein U0289_13935 [Cyclobacteriaceae bacterium]|jgi:hypothetical protein|nr:hypothetical protein [Cytophagales bacterium]HNP77022.1 hypothetical protein [Cyclobacteriaceae bacterium]HQQ82834.1 hypothetical protein [Cyclobacteriaceae bacterium]